MRVPCSYNISISKSVFSCSAFANSGFIDHIMKSVPIISIQTFWDIDPASLSFEEAAEWVILRVFDKGSLQEVLQVRDYYGSALVMKTLTSQISILPRHSILLAKALFQLSFKDFKCFCSIL